MAQKHVVKIRLRPGNRKKCDVPDFKMKKGDDLQFDFPEAPDSVVTFTGTSPFGDNPGVRIELGKARIATVTGHFEETVVWGSGGGGDGAGSGDVG